MRELARTNEIHSKYPSRLFAPIRRWFAAKLGAIDRDRCYLLWIAREIARITAIWKLV